MIYGERVRQARQLNGINQTRFAEALEVSQAAVARIESDRLIPSNELLEGIAFQTGFPPSFFRQPPEEDFPGPYKLLFRAKANITNREEDRAFRYAQVGYRILRSLLKKVDPLPVRLPLGARPDQGPEDAADATRSALGLSNDRPIDNLFDVLERNGVLGLALPVRLKGIDAFHVWAGERGERPIIITTYVTDDGARLRWNIAHELGHLVLHPSITGRIRVVETEANEFARQFLLPDRAMFDELEPPITLSSVASLKQRWGVSMQALINRAWSLEVISDRQRTYLYKQLSARGWRTREPSNLDVPIERPQTLPQLAGMLYGEPIEVARLAKDTNLLPSMIESYLYVHGAAEGMNLPARERGLLDAEASA